MRAFDIFKQFNQKIHERGVDQSIGNIRIQNDRLEVNENIQLIVNSSTGSHSVVNFVEMTFNLDCFNFVGHLLGAPNFEWKILRIENQFSGFLDIFVADDRLDSCIRVVNKELIDGLQRHLTLRLVLCIWVQAHWTGVCCVLSNAVIIIFFISILHVSRFVVSLLSVQSICVLGECSVVDIHNFILVDGLQVFLVWIRSLVTLLFLLHLIIIINIEAKIDFLITIGQVDVEWCLGILLVCISIFVQRLHHVLGDALRNTQWINFLGWFVLDIWNEVSVSHLLFVELFRVDVSALFQIFVELRLSRYLSLVDLLSPERMLSQVLPIDTLDRIFL